MKDKPYSVSIIPYSIKCLQQIISNINRIGTAKDQFNIYFILELVEGFTLDKLLQMYGKLNLKLVKLITYQVAQALKYMHSEGYLYRDLKANNIMIDSSGKVTLIDFGLTKKIDKQRTYSYCGTLHSMAPEILNSQSYSYQVDHYALGILIYELLVGYPPFGLKGIDLKDKIISGISTAQIELIQDEFAKDIVTLLLQQNEINRLGHLNGIQDIIGHPFFSIQNIDGIIYRPIIQVLPKDQKQLHELGLIYDIQDDIDSFGLKRNNIINQENEDKLSVQTKKRDIFDEIFQ